MRAVPSVPAPDSHLAARNSPLLARCVRYYTRRLLFTLAALRQLDLVNRTSEFARVFGVDFLSVLLRGSQYRVESMLLRISRPQVRGGRSGERETERV